ncbi:hypothetical protein P7K49_013549, partial [Saguinus oedipus]
MEEKNHLKEKVPPEYHLEKKSLTRKLVSLRRSKNNSEARLEQITSVNTVGLTQANLDKNPLLRGEHSPIGH